MRVGLLVVGDTDALCGDRRTADHLHPPAAAKQKVTIQEGPSVHFTLFNTLYSNTNTVKVCL